MNVIPVAGEATVRLPVFKLAGCEIRCEVINVGERDDITPVCLFSGFPHRLIPFAALFDADVHLDEIEVSQGDCDLLCFDLQSTPHQIVVWKSGLATEAYKRCVETLDATPNDEDSAIPFERFTELVSPTYAEFRAMLQFEDSGAR